MPAKHLTETDNGKTIELNPGDTLTLSLYENATTGYRWFLDAPDKKIVSVQQETSGHSQTVGRGGQVTWTLKGKTTGTTQLKLKLWREWEGDASIQKTFAVQLTVR